MADQIREVQTVDVQLLNANRERPKTYKFDNPKPNLTRADVTTAFSPALAGGWLLAADDTVAMYIGDVILNTSKKVTLDGEDFYVTPDRLALKNNTPQNLTITGAQVQGYNIKNFTSNSASITAKNLNITIAENALSVTVIIEASESLAYSGSFNLILIIQGTSVTIPCTISSNA